MKRLIERRFEIVALAALALLLALAASAMPAEAWAAGGSIDMSVVVSKEGREARPGDVGMIDLGVDVGLAIEVADGSADDLGGLVDIGIDVGYLGYHEVNFVGMYCGDDGNIDATRACEQLGTQMVETGGFADSPDGLDREGYWADVWYMADPRTHDGIAPVKLSSLQVENDTVLYCLWKRKPDLVLDVTVPMSVRFAVNAVTRDVVTPDLESYAIKSRTAANVTVDALVLESRQAELEGIFGLSGGGDDWTSALQSTVLSVRSEHARETIEVPFAGDDAAGPSWANERLLTGEEKVGYTLKPFDPASAGPESRLALKFGLEVSDQLEVKVGQPGAAPITHLRVTVSAVA